MGRVSTIECLPPAVRKEIDDRLIASGFAGYKELAAELQRRGHRKVSKSGLHRYGQQVERRIQLARARQQIEAAGVAPGIAAELTGDATLVVVVDRRNNCARAVNVKATAAEVHQALKALRGSS
jgi:hypothetical protein